jgi:hypothetical protein
MARSVSYTDIWTLLTAKHKHIKLLTNAVTSFCKKLENQDQIYISQNCLLKVRGRSAKTFFFSLVRACSASGAKIWPDCPLFLLALCNVQFNRPQKAESLKEV